MADTLEAIKQALGGYVREIKIALEKRAKLAADMNAAIAKTQARYQPEIDLQDEYIKGMVDQIKDLVTAHFKELFPTAKDTMELKLPYGVIKVTKNRPTHSVEDEAGLFDLLRKRKIINTVAPAKRTTNFTVFKKLFPGVLKTAIKLGFVSAKGDGEKLTIKPNDADVNGAPDMSRPI